MPLFSNIKHEACLDPFSYHAALCCTVSLFIKSPNGNSSDNFQSLFAGEAKALFLPGSCSWVLVESSPHCWRTKSTESKSLISYASPSQPCQSETLIKNSIWLYHISLVVFSKGCVLWQLLMPASMQETFQGGWAMWRLHGAHWAQARGSWCHLLAEHVPPRGKGTLLLSHSPARGRFGKEQALAARSRAPPTAPGAAPASRGTASGCLQCTAGFGEGFPPPACTCPPASQCWGNPSISAAFSHQKCFKTYPYGAQIKWNKNKTHFTPA